MTALTPELAEAWLALSAERDQALRISLAREREAYARGYAAGLGAGRDTTLHELAAFQRWATGLTASLKPLEELELARWGPGGREHYADPREGDYPGKASGGSS